MARKTIGQIKKENAGSFTPRNLPPRKPGSSLKVKPNFKVDSSKVGLTAPGGSGTAKYDPSKDIPYGETYISAEVRKRGVAPTGGSVSGVYNGQFVDASDSIKSRGRVNSPKSYVQKKRDEAKNYVQSPGRPAPTRVKSSSSPSPKSGPGAAGAGAPMKDSGSRSSSAATDTQKPNRGAGSKPNGADKNAAPKNSAQSASSVEPKRQTRPSKSSDSKKSAPAVPGTLNYFMRKAAQAGDKDVKRRAYQMYANAKKSPGKVGALNMSIAQKDLPKNPKKGDTVKGKAGVTWTWSGSRWTRGKAK